jgi:hypothetical protein
LFHWCPSRIGPRCAATAGTLRYLHGSLHYFEFLIRRSEFPGAILYHHGTTGTTTPICNRSTPSVLPRHQDLPERHPCEDHFFRKRPGGPALINAKICLGKLVLHDNAQQPS